VQPYKVDERSHKTSVMRTWTPPPGADPQTLGETLTQPYRGDNDRWIFPAIAGDSLPMHPLLAWWAVLYTLSMLARYQPAAWTAHIDINTNSNAIPLETVLTRALDVCPELILFVIRAVTAE
jgi:YaaC-like protein